MSSWWCLKSQRRKCGSMRVRNYLLRELHLESYGSLARYVKIQEAHHTFHIYISIKYKMHRKYLLNILNILSFKTSSVVWSPLVMVWSIQVHLDKVGKKKKSKFLQRKLEYFSYSVADVLPMCHKSEWEQRTEHEAQRTNLDTDETHTPNKTAGNTDPRIWVFFNYGTITSIRKGDIWKKHSLRVCHECYLDSTCMKTCSVCASYEESVWVGGRASVCSMWVKSLVYKRSGFSTQYCLVSLSSFSFLSVPTLHNLSIKAEGGTERERKTETEKEAQMEKLRK